MTDPTSILTETVLAEIEELARGNAGEGVRVAEAGEGFARGARDGVAVPRPVSVGLRARRLREGV